MSDLNTAIVAINDKIAASAAGATAEELAYLGTALDRIGGRATVYEVVTAGEAKKAELTEAAEALLQDFRSESDGVLAAAKAELNQRVAHLTGAIAQSVAAANAELDSAIGATTEVTDSVRLSAQQALNGSMFYNHFFMSQK